MKATATQADKPVFQKTEVPCLYRYSSNGVYYALVKHEGKQKRASLETTDKTVAKRKPADFLRDLGKVDPSQGRVTLQELCDRYLLTVQNQAPATVYRKKHIVGRLLQDLPEGAGVQVSKIRQSALEAWLAKYKFGYASQTLYVLLLKALFDLAVILHLKSGRRSHSAARIDVCGSGTQLDSKTAVLPMETEVGFDPETMEPMRLGEFLACDQEDLSITAGRNLDWKQFLASHDYRYGVIVKDIVHDKTALEEVKDRGERYHRVRSLRFKLADELREFMGPDAAADATKVPL